MMLGCRLSMPSFFLSEGAYRAAAQAEVRPVLHLLVIYRYALLLKKAEGASEVDVQHFEKILPKLVCQYELCILFYIPLLITVVGFLILHSSSNFIFVNECIKW